MTAAQPEGAQTRSATRNSARKSRLPGSFIHRRCCRNVTAGKTAGAAAYSAKIMWQGENKSLCNALPSLTEMPKNWAKIGEAAAAWNPAPAAPTYRQSYPQNPWKSPKRPE